MKHTITVRVQDDMKKQLDEISKAKHKPVSDIVRESLRRFIAVERFRNLRESVIPYAEKQGIYTDEDVFNEIS